LNNIYFDLLYSSTLLEGTNSLEDFHLWLSERLHQGIYRVDQARLDDLDKWSLNKTDGFYGHKSGKFFTVSGLDVYHEVDGFEKSWTQIIVNQSDQGILGFLAKKIDGVIHLLVQAKMEPGNIGFIQISPTVQSTKSNYTRVHEGRGTKFIEYFLEQPQGKTIFCQLRSEQGARYFRKRNQNIVVLLDEGQKVEKDENFYWLTLGQLKELHKIPNLVHLDCRSIIGGMPYSIPLGGNLINEVTGNNLMLDSLQCLDSSAINSITDLQNWFTKEKMRNIKHTSLVHLQKANSWSYDGVSIKHESGKFFDIIGVNVYAPEREVSSWSQPLIKCADGGMIGLISQVQKGTMHFLIHSRFEAGLIDSVELAPTIQYTPQNYSDNQVEDKPLFTEYFNNESKYERLVDTFLSNEGGRFFKSENHHLVLKIPESQIILVPENYKWMTLSQLNYFGSMELSLNMELRSLLFCITFV
jgi:dTDP-4-dehydro-6-deoxy-alpha-D-glucopyranose 2,3-dehydratase